jgi:hypothetical protein
VKLIEKERLNQMHKILQKNSRIVRTLTEFFTGLPLLIVIAWSRTRRPPQIATHLNKNGGQG